MSGLALLSPVGGLQCLLTNQIAPPGLSILNRALLLDLAHLSSSDALRSPIHEK